MSGPGPHTGPVPASGPQASGCVRAGLSLLADPGFLLASEPLFATGAVEALEWSFDTAWQLERLPDWLSDVLACYAASGWLLGHGVGFSLLSGRLRPRQQAWLERLQEECRGHAYRMVSEHLGFLSAGDFHDGAPLPVPCSAASIALGRARLEQLAEHCGRPVGLENLATALCRRDVLAEGDFLDALLEPLDGFLLLDLHNLYCRAHNFQVPARDLLKRYPLQRVRQIHIAGGSWSAVSWQPGVAPVRRDSHDEAVPEQVFDLLAAALPLCPRLEAVVLERISGSLQTPAQITGLRQDFLKMRGLLGAGNG